MKPYGRLQNKKRLDARGSNPLQGLIRQTEGKQININVRIKPFEARQAYLEV
jgi:hypothetical protein